MGISPLGVVGCYHIGCHGLAEAAWTGYTYKFITFLSDDIIHLSDDKRLVYVEWITSVISKLDKISPEMCTRTSFKEGAKKAAARILSDKSLQKEDPEFDAFSDRVVDAMERVEKELLEI